MKHPKLWKPAAGFSALVVTIACASGTARSNNALPADPAGLIGSVTGDTLTADTTAVVTGGTTTTGTSATTPATPPPAEPPGLIGSVAGDSTAAGGGQTLTPPALFTLSPINSDANIVALLHASNQAEIQAGQLAQQRATNPAVRSFAQMMVTEHTALDQQGSSIASQHGITAALPDNNLPQAQQGESTALTAAGNGAAFDRAYIAQQVEVHARTLALVDASIARAQQSALKTMLESQVRPKVAQHLQQALTIQSQLGTQ